METTWFMEITDQELIETEEEQGNQNTKRITAYDVELFKSFIQTSNPDLLDSTSLHELSLQVPNDLLSKFIFGVRKKDGSDYEPTSLRGFLSSIQRYLNKQSYGFTSFTDVVLKLSLTERDPVRVYKIYASKRPESIKTDDSPFYLALSNLQPSSLSINVNLQQKTFPAKRERSSRKWKRVR